MKRGPVEEELWYQLYYFVNTRKPGFSLLFEVADKSLKVADRAIRDTRWRGRAICYKGKCYRRVAEGGPTPDTKCLSKNKVQNLKVESG